MTSSDSLNRLIPSMEKEYFYWKKNMIIFIKGMDYDIWTSINNILLPIPLFDSVVKNKTREIWTKEGKEKMQHNMKGKTLALLPLSLLMSFYVFLTIIYYKNMGYPSTYP